MQIDTIKTDTQLFVVDYDRVGGFILAHLDDDGYTMIRDDLTPNERVTVAQCIINWAWSV